MKYYIQTNPLSAAGHQCLSSTVNPKMKLLFAHPHLITDQHALIYSVEHKR